MTGEGSSRRRCNRRRRLCSSQRTVGLKEPKLKRRAPAAASRLPINSPLTTQTVFVFQSSTPSYRGAHSAPWHRQAIGSRGSFAAMDASPQSAHQQSFLPPSSLFCLRVWWCLCASSSTTLPAFVVWVCGLTSPLRRDASMHSHHVHVSDRGGGDLTA
ncbi:uncharacterized protein BKA78DRAFT_81070 [Phyllosticta capitalensis]|uniref:uncharacterized protein n=1 Tax=Phyllosticta capitalensis TaxID=121624 RepID=UPI00312D4FCA